MFLATKRSASSLLAMFQLGTYHTLQSEPQRLVVLEREDLRIHQS